MADSIVKVPQIGSERPAYDIDNRKVSNAQGTGGLADRQIVGIGGTSGNDVVEPLAAPPTGNERALPVRQVGASPLPDGAASESTLAALLTSAGTIITGLAAIFTRQADGTQHTVVDNLPATQPISGTVTANQGTSPWVVADSTAATALAALNSLVTAIKDTDGVKKIVDAVSVVQANAANLLATVTQGPAAALSGAWPVAVTDGVSVLGTGATPLRTDPTGTTTQPVSNTNLDAALSTRASESTLASILIRQADGTQHTAVDNFPASQAVTGPLTDTQLRATAVPVSATPLDVALSTRASEATLSSVLSGIAAIFGRQTDGSQHTVVDNFPGTQPVSGTVTADQGAAGGTPWPTTDSALQTILTAIRDTAGVKKITDAVTVVQATAANLLATVSQGPAAALSGAWPVEVTDGTSVLGTAAAPLRTDPTGTTTQPISAVSLPLPTGAAREHQHARDTNNEQLDTLGADAVFTGNFTQVDHVSSFQVLYAAITPITSVAIEWSNDGISPIGGLLGSSNVPIRQISGYYVAYYVGSGNTNMGAWYRVKVVNGATPQSALPLTISLAWLSSNPYNGAWDFLDATLGQLSRALLVRAAMPQLVDGGNTIAISSAEASPGSPWVGTFYSTRPAGIVRQLVILASNVSSGLGGIFAFEYADNPVSDPSNILETRSIGDFSTVRDFDLNNAGATYFRVHFEPSRALSPGELVFIKTIQRTQYDGPFARLANQELEEQNAAMGQQFSYLKLFNARTGKSINVRPTETGALRTADDRLRVTQSGSLRTSGDRDDISVKFSDGLHLGELGGIYDDGSVNGTATFDATEGRAVFSVPSTPGSTAVFRSAKKAVYEPGHTILGDQTIVASAQPTGDGFIEWGWGDSTNCLGYRFDADGLSVIRRKNGVLEDKILQADWNRDPCLGDVGSQFRFNFTPQVLSALKNNRYIVEYEWLGVAPPDYIVVAPNKAPIQVHTIEFPNQHTGTTISNPELPLFVHVQNDSTTGQVLSAACGSWQGTTVSSRVVLTGRTPDGDFNDIRTQGRDSRNSTVTPLNGSEVFRGKWFNWQESYIKLVVDLQADVSGQLWIDFSQVPTPTDDDDSSITDATGPFDYDPVTTPLLRRHSIVQSRWVRIRYINGVAAQAFFSLDTAFLTTDPGTGAAPATVTPLRTSMVSMGRALLTVRDESDPLALKDWPVKNTTGAPEVHVVGQDEDIKIGALRNFECGQLNVGPSAIMIPAPTISRVKGLSITNTDPDTDVFWGGSDLTAENNSDCILARGGKDVELDGTNSIFLIAGSTGAATAEDNRFPASTQNNNGVVNPNNLLTDNGSYATLDNQGDNVQATGFTPAGAQPNISTIKLKCKAKKDTNQTAEQVSFFEVKTGNAGAVGTVVTSASIAGGALRLYLAFVSREVSSATQATVTGVVGLGLTWSQAKSQNSDDDKRRLDCWFAFGTATAGTVTATFGSNPASSHIAVLSFTGAASTPIQDNGGTTANSASVVGPALTGTARGMSVLGVAEDNTTSTPGSGYTEQSDEKSASGTIDGLTTETKALVSGGSETATATLAAAKHYAAVGVTIAPAAAYDPVVTLTYKIGAVTGITQLVMNLSSTSDDTFIADLTGDRSWLPADVGNVVVTVTATTLTAAQALIDALWLDIVEIASGAVARVTYSWLGEAS